MKAFKVTPQIYPLWQSKLKSFEGSFTYPLGEDFFSIDHGEDYLAFFQRMGKDHLFATEDEGELVAVGSGVIHHRLNAWYLCDMKVHPAHRGKKIPLKMFRKFFLSCYLKSQKGFALNMESADGSINPIRKIMSNLPWTPFKEGAELCFYYEEVDSTKQAMEVLSNFRPNIHFSSLKGIKDLVLKSTGHPIPLLHMEWGQEKRGLLNSPQPLHLHMWCLDERDPVNVKLSSLNIFPKAKGRIFHHRLSGVNWSELRTSEL